MPILGIPFSETEEQIKETLHYELWLFKLIIDINLNKAKPKKATWKIESHGSSNCPATFSNLKSKLGTDIN